MARFFMHWEIVRERLADDPKTIASGWQQLVGMVKQDLETGLMKDWGAIPGSLTGYGILEGNDIDVMKVTMRYAPYVKFDVRPLVGVAEVGEFLNAVTG